MSPAIIGFDADDTLWHSEGYYRQAQREFEAILSAYLHLEDARLHERLLEVQRANLRLFGYGAKGMTLSLIETAIAATQARISATDIHRLVEIGKEVLAHPVELLPGIRAAVEAVAGRHPVVLITKGDLFHQERKVAESGLGDLFRRIEVVSEKDRHSYARLLREFDVPPERFAMVGNSAKSDILPVLALGGWAVHMPYPLLFALEEAELDATHPRLAVVERAEQIPGAIAGFGI